MSKGILIYDFKTMHFGDKLQLTATSKTFFCCHPCCQFIRLMSFYMVAKGKKPHWRYFSWMIGLAKCTVLNTAAIPERKSRL